jgi:hypothetical protein
LFKKKKESAPIDDVAEPTTTEADSENEDDDGILSPSKPSHIEFGKSMVKAEDLVLIKKLGYFGENDEGLVWFAGEEVILEPKDDEVLVLKSFFRARLQFPLYVGDRYPPGPLEGENPCVGP